VNCPICELNMAPMNKHDYCAPCILIIWRDEAAKEDPDSEILFRDELMSRENFERRLKLGAFE